MAEGVFQGMVLVAAALLRGRVEAGLSLAVAAMATSVARQARTRREQELRERGLEPRDERTLAVTGRASYGALSTFVLLAAVAMLAGVASGIPLRVPLWDVLGLLVAAQILVYAFFYRYYDQRM
jgi:uncharacterized membrane protein